MYMFSVIAGLSNLYLPIQEFRAPSLGDILRFVDYVDEARERNEVSTVNYTTIDEELGRQNET
jgi:hypothetical protein